MSEEQKKPGIDWEKIVADSNGSRIFLPSGFEKQAAEIEEKREAYDKKVHALAKEQLTINTAVNNLFFALREYLEKNGHKDIWIMDVGYETAALKQKKYVVNITAPQQQQR